MNTSSETRPSSYSTYERLWNAVNQLEKFSDWNCSLDHDEILHQHPSQSQNMSTTKTADEVITSSVTNLVCNISSISSNVRYSYPEVDKDLIPGTFSQLDMDGAIKKWKYARCFDKMLPKGNPSSADAVSFYAILLTVYKFTSNTITECLLEYSKTCV